jgi:hypothetical protein
MAAATSYASRISTPPILTSWSPLSSNGLELKMVVRCNSMLARSSLDWRPFVRGKGLRLFAEPQQVTAEEIGTEPFKPPRGFAKLLKLTRRPLSSRHRQRPLIHRHEIDLGQLPAVVLKRDARHRPIPLASNHHETVSGPEPDLEGITRPVRRGGDLLEPEASKE